MRSIPTPELRVQSSAAFPRVKLPVPLTPRLVAVVIAITGAITIAAMFILQYAGFEPCELCYMERIPYYISVPAAALAAVLAGGANVRLARALLIVCALAFLFDAGLSAYHAGVEWKWWPGPDACSGQLTSDPNISLLERLKNARIVRCDEAALRIFGISLAGYGALLAAGLSGLAFFGAFSRAGRSR